MMQRTRALSLISRLSSQLDHPRSLSAILSTTQPLSTTPSLPHIAFHPSPSPPRPLDTTKRHYAGGNRTPPGVPQGAYQQPITAGRQSNIRVTLVSSNLLAEPYKGEPAPLPLASYLTPSGWKEQWKRWMAGVKSIYTIAKLRKNVDGWNLPGFKEDALHVYEETCKALAQGNKTALRQLVTPAIYTDMKRQIKAREDGGWKRLEWALVQAPTLKEIEVVQGRLISIDPKNDNTGFAQLTVRFTSLQTFVAFDGRGKVVAGGEGEQVKVDDFWVFERPLKQQMANRWRVAGRLTVPSPGYLPRA